MLKHNWLSAKIRRYRSKRRIRKLEKASKHPFAVPVITISVLLFFTLIGLLIFNANKKPELTKYVVIVSHDHVHQVVPSIEPTVGALLNKLNIKLNQGDVVEPSLATHINQDKFRINVYRALPVVINDSGNLSYVFSAATTPRSIAAQAGLNPNPNDLITASQNTNYLTSAAIGQVVSIKRSVPINIILYGTPIVTRSHSDTVEQMLKEKNLSLKHGDTVQPSLSSAITPGENVFVLHAGTSIATSTQTIPEPVQTINDPSLSAGSTAIRQQGSPGIILITYQVNTKTGVKTQLQSVQVQAPVTKIIAKGTAPVSGSLSNWLYQLRKCESGGNYQDNTGNGYYGAYQFSPGTWNTLNTGYARADLAPPSVQDQAIIRNTNRSSAGLAGQNPGCYYRTGISAFPPGS